MYSATNFKRTNVFKDGHTVVDFIIVMTKEMIPGGMNLNYAIELIHYLQERGIKCEINKSSVKDQLYLCIHLPPRAVEHFATLYKIDIHNSGHRIVPNVHSYIDICNTPLTINNACSFKRKGGATSMERIYISNEMLCDAKFADNVGIYSLIKLGVITTTYPLHDGPAEYSEIQDDSELNDRQLLAKYWGNIFMWHKQQPLNLIEKYFGSEVAFYFAWFGFYNQMLIPASIMGVVCFIGSIIRLYSMSHPAIEEICNSDLYMCQFCSTYQTCVLKPLNSSCTFSKFEYIFDNRISMFFATFMTLWATLYISLWKRNECILRTRWNIETIDYDTRVRREYKQALKKLKKSHAQVAEALFKRRILRTFATSAICLLLVIVIITVVVTLIIFRIAMASAVAHHYGIVTDGSDVLVIILAATFQLIFIKIFGWFGVPISVMLTTMEIPRTQRDFDTSVINKRYFLAFVNNYIPLFYIAFIKGRFYNPSSKTKSIYNLSNDIVHPSGTLLPLCIQLIFFLLFKSLLRNIIEIIKMTYKRRKYRRNQTETEEVRQWEKDYDLAIYNQYFLTQEFTEEIIQYGFLTFFVAACSLAPLFALLNSSLRLRINAEKLLKNVRRPVPRIHPGIGQWCGILEVATFFSAATNAFVLAFTSDFVAKEIYRFRKNTLEGYLETTLSEIDLKKLYYDLNDNVDKYTKHIMQTYNVTKCYYKGNRNPPDHKHPYELTTEFYYELGIRLLYVIVFEHFILIFRSVIQHFVPETPMIVKEVLNYELTKERQRKLKRFSDAREVKNKSQ